MAAYGPSTQSNSNLTASSGRVNAVFLRVESEQLCQNPGASGIWARLRSPGVSRRTLWMGGSVCFITGDWEELRVYVCVCCSCVPVHFYVRVFTSAPLLCSWIFFFFFFDGKGNRCCRNDVALLKKKRQLNLKEGLMAEVFCSSTPVTFTVWCFGRYFFL